MKIGAALNLPQHVTVTDVVARDGFQNDDRMISTDDKVRVIEGLVRAGVPSIEVTSFVHPRLVPQLADAADVIARLPQMSGVTYSALVPNVKGAQRALAAEVRELHLVVSASESHNRANLNRSAAESLAQLADVAAFVRAEQPEARMVATIATAFHCPFEGRTPLQRVVRIVGKLVGAGIDAISLADTDGAANPLQIWQTITALRTRFDAVTWSLHLHNTRDMGLANAFAGLQAGVTQFDAALGGIGGCPFAPGATGNISTEDLVHMLHEMGVATGIDLDLLLAEGERLRTLVGHELVSAVAKAGPSSRLHPFEDVVIADSRRLQREEVIAPH